MGAHANAVQTYIRAKDENRPHLMHNAFTPDANLEMRVETENISFPPKAKGIERITQVLVRDFGRANENVYTFCLNKIPTDDETDFQCPYLVGMSDKETESIRVGCGYYNWQFGANELVHDLTITIKSMVILASSHQQAIMDWLSHLPHPWCPAETAAKTMPSIFELKEVRQFLVK